MTILSQQHSGKFEWHQPARTPTPRKRLRIKRGPEGWSWFSKSGRRMTLPVATRKEAKRIRKARLSQIKYFKRQAKRKRLSTITKA